MQTQFATAAYPEPIPHSNAANFTPSWLWILALMMAEGCVELKSSVEAWQRPNRHKCCKFTEAHGNTSGFLLLQLQYQCSCRGSGNRKCAPKHVEENVLFCCKMQMSGWDSSSIIDFGENLVRKQESRQQPRQWQRQHISHFFCLVKRTWFQYGDFTRRAANRMQFRNVTNALWERPLWF